MSLSLYEINRAILDLVDPETGEITDWEAFDRLQMDKTEKLENVALWYKNLVAEAAAIRAEEVNLAKRRGSLEKKAEGLKKYLCDALCGEKFTTARCSISWRKTIKTVISNVDEVAAWCEDNGARDLVVYGSPSVSKDEIKKLLKGGAEIPGAYLTLELSMGVK